MTLLIVKLQNFKNVLTNVSLLRYNKARKRGHKNERKQSIEKDS
nr:MAG TPA: hypothetical protein [Caudoviricetes sp.]